MTPVAVRLGGGSVALLEPELYETDRALLEEGNGQRAQLVAPLALELAGGGARGELLEAPHAAGLYLLHLDPPYRHAAHYLGYARDIARRLAEHRAGGTKASPLLRAQLEAGGALLLARVFAGGDRTLERRLKRQGGLSRHCPLCRAGGRWHR